MGDSTHGGAGGSLRLAPLFSSPPADGKAYNKVLASGGVPVADDRSAAATRLRAGKAPEYLYVQATDYKSWWRDNIKSAAKVIGGVFGAAAIGGASGLGEAGTAAEVAGTATAASGAAAGSSAGTLATATAAVKSVGTIAGALGTVKAITSRPPEVLSASPGDGSGSTLAGVGNYDPNTGKDMNPIQGRPDGAIAYAQRSGGASASNSSGNMSLLIIVAGVLVIALLTFGALRK